MPAVLQSVSVVGSYGLSFLSLVLGGVWFYFYKKDFYILKWCMGIFSVLVIFGMLRILCIQRDMNEIDRDGIYRVRVVDAMLEQDLIGGDAMEIYHRLPLMMDRRDVDLFVLPESAVQYDITRDGYYEKIFSYINNEKSGVVVGFNRYDNFDFDNGTYDIYNSAALLERDGIVEVYDKRHLVPFGEYMPLRFLIPFKKFTEGVKDFSRGNEVKVFEVNGVVWFPLICYEMIFSGLKIPNEVRGIVNISNDGWFSEFGKAQHLEIVKMRAVEYGLPVVRAVNESFNKGEGTQVISAVGMNLNPVDIYISGNGGVVKDYILPQKINKTVFRRFGNSIFVFFVGFSFLIMLMYGWKYRNIKK